MCKTNCKFEKFENTVNLMYAVCAMSGNDDLNYVCKFEKFENTVNLMYAVCAMSGMMI